MISFIRIQHTKKKFGISYFTKLYKKKFGIFTQGLIHKKCENVKFCKKIKNGKSKNLRCCF